jgi:hypothetical protein
LLTRPREAGAAVEAAEPRISAEAVAVISAVVRISAAAALASVVAVGILAARVTLVVDLRYRGPRLDQVSAVRARLRFAVVRTEPSAARQPRG